MALHRWWREADDVARVTLYTRCSMFPLAAVGPFVVGSIPASRAGEITGPVRTTLVAVVLAVSVVVLYVLDRLVTGHSLRRRDYWVWGGAVLAGALIVSLAPIGNARGPGLVLIAAFGLAPLGGWGARYYVPVGAVVAVAIALQSDARHDGPGLMFEVAFFVLAVLVAVASAVQLSLWLVNVVRRLADADRTRAELAVAEERLRFARDLHDIVGRDLSAIAMTSDLAAELARRGRPEAAERAEEARNIAQESLRQVRAAVRGYRAVDLRTELEGSAALLRSAGVTSRISAEVATLPDDVRTAAAWVVREGVTNVVRHSAATLCRIEVREQDGNVRVRIENDGASGPLGHGSGLAGLAERLRPLGGELTFEQRDGVFVLCADLPANAVVEEARV
ncbi:sensor histidine kinase [Cryptosporangium aurantiacum]|uniref:Two-component system, NarL family, sensor histidine kinase DesK n=1 Tax=Cryptosporangium aurantiacum TaxID=134849 RepID=A0A1M7J884_9ACTN|nr:histidine kinase [Cryptosporangium aurantiacum]SHM49192.1 two-component system, NarL family, sensor histidine kinase DesK [Cryptosporangium aurantiacum]